MIYSLSLDSIIFTVDRASIRLCRHLRQNECHKKGKQENNSFASEVFHESWRKIASFLLKEERLVGYLPIFFKIKSVWWEMVWWLSEDCFEKMPIYIRVEDHYFRVANLLNDKEKHGWICFSVKWRYKPSNISMWYIIVIVIRMLILRMYFHWNQCEEEVSLRSNRNICQRQIIGHKYFVSWKDYFIIIWEQEPVVFTLTW